MRWGETQVTSTRHYDFGLCAQEGVYPWLVSGDVELEFHKADGVRDTFKFFITADDAEIMANNILDALARRVNK